MSFIQRVFWNRDEGRVRALWRLIAQVVILIPLLFVLEIPAILLAYGILAAQGQIALEQLADPGTAQALMMENPVMLIANYLALVPAVTLSIWLAGRFLDRRPFRDFGLHLDRDWWIDFAFGLGLGAVLMGLIFVIELAAGWITVTGTFVTGNPDGSFLPAILVPLAAFLAVGFYEELFSRGYQLTNMAEGLNGRGIGPRGAILIATLLSSAVFGVLHILNPNAGLFSTLSITLAGINLAMGYLLTGELAIPIGLHITWNFFQGNVFGFPVSGTRMGAATCIAVEQGGPTLWTGGAFGPEAGLLGLGGIGLGIVLTIVWVRRRYGNASLHTPLAEPPARPEPET